MLKKRIIGALLVLVFSIQLVPVLQVGSLLYQNQWTEEMPHGSDAGAPTGKKSADPSNQFISLFDHILPFILHSLTNLAFSCCEEAYSSRHADDIQTPPPNFPG
jgi:hypothetical protein